MPITNLSIPYPDFKLHEVIDPEQFDFNNGAIIEKMNAVLLVLNQITDSITVDGSGADKISLTPIAPFTSNKLQAYLKEVIVRLTSTTSGSSGAGFIGTSTLAGVTGITVSAQLASLKSLLDTEKARITALETRATNVEGRATTLEARATNLESTKSDKATTYTKTEVDTKVFGTANVTDGSITTPKLANQSVTADKIHSSLLENVAVSTHRNASVLDHPDSSVTFIKLAPDVVEYIVNAGVADSVAITDIGNYFTSENAEGALQEVGQTLSGMRTSLVTSANSLLGG